MTSLTEIMPPESTPAEIAVVYAIDQPPPMPLLAEMDPDTCSEQMLPALAFQNSVDLWYNDWSSARKRLMIKRAPFLAEMKGTPAAIEEFLTFVDAEIVDEIVYPKRFVVGRAIVGRTPIGHPPFLARYLIKVKTQTPSHAFVVERAVIGRARIKTPSREPFLRVFAALRAAKAPETQIRVDLGWMRQWRLSDAVPLAAEMKLGAYIVRKRL